MISEWKGRPEYDQKYILVLDRMRDFSIKLMTLRKYRVCLKLHISAPPDSQGSNRLT